MLIKLHSCAVSSRSPLAHGDPNILYVRLLATAVLRTNGISTRYTIHYPSGNRVGPISQNNGYVFINDQNDNWQIFVPQNRDAREISYRKKLPYALTKLLKIDPSISESIGHVLNSSIAVIDELLEEGGIGKVANIEPPPRRVVEELYDDEPDIREEEAASEVSGRAPSPFARLETPSSQTLTSESSTSQGTPPFRVPRVADSEGYMHGSFTVNAFVRLLDSVIRIARQTVLPHSDAVPGIALGQLHPGFDHNAAFGTRSQGEINHDFKIGAAGELFVSDSYV